MKEKNKLPVMYGYVIAFEARVRAGLYDCNDPEHPNKMSSFVVEVLTGFVIIDKLLLKDIKCRDKK